MTGENRALVAIGATAAVAVGAGLALHAMSGGKSSGGPLQQKQAPYSIVVFLVEGSDAKPSGKTIRLPRNMMVADLIAAAAQALRQDTVR